MLSLIDCIRRVAAGNMDRMEYPSIAFFSKSFFFPRIPNEACAIEDLIKMEKSNFAIINIKKL